MYTLEKEKAKLPYVLPGGKRIPSVTTVLDVLSKRGLLKWANNLGLRGISLEDPVATSYAIDVGNLAHYLIECHAKGEEPDISPEFSDKATKKAAEIFIEFLNYLHGRNGKIVGSELVLMDEDQEYGGTLDLLVEFPDGPGEYWDVKTSKEIHREHYIQVGAYGILLRKNQPQHSKKTPRIILLPKGGKFYAPDISPETRIASEKVWLDLLRTYRSLREMEKSIDI